MKKFSNKQKISLPIAVWLAEDQYQHNSDPMHVSATALLKSTKQIILATRLPELEPGTVVTDDMLEDISNRVSSAMGTSLHNGIEGAWRNNYAQSMRDLGYPESVIERVIINPEPSELQDNSIPVYLEKRTEKKLGPFMISGQFDLVLDGGLNDYKSTGVYAFMNGSNDDKYRIQGSIYRWLNPKIITNDHMYIQYIFTDWSALRANIEKAKGYPPARVVAHPIELLSVSETEKWLKAKLTDIYKHRDLPEEQIPDCSAEELWQSPPQYKYFKNPDAKRATKVFDDFYLANECFVQNGSVGEIRTINGQVKACGYCKAFEVCKQKDRYINDGTLAI